MQFDLPTLMFVGGLLGPVCGSVLLLIWWQHRQNYAPLCWAAGHTVQGSAVILLAVGFADGWAWSAPVGQTLMILAPAALWSGARAFWGKPARLTVLAGAALLWAAAAAGLGARGAIRPTILLDTAIFLAFAAAATWTLATGGRERLKARLPLIVLMIAHAATFSLSVPAALSGEVGSGPPPLASVSGIMYFETLVYLVGTTIFFVALIKEREELQRREEAETDVLTGLPNRRAFLSAAERMAERRRRDGSPFAVAAFDLDHFKQVNDTYGHAVGDRALQTFAEAARKSLRPGDLVSRIGGEEFAAIFPSTDLDTGLIMAERIRRAFAEAGLVIDGREIGATVSAGVAFAAPDGALNELMERADAALYRAKLNGRDRVECDGERRAFPRLVNVA